MRAGNLYNRNEEKCTRGALDKKIQSSEDAND